MTRFFVTKGGNKMEEFKYLIPEESIDAIITNVSKLRTLIMKVKMLQCAVILQFH